jgi:hypothetical protein
MVFYIVRRCFGASHEEPTETTVYSGQSTPSTHIRRSAEEPITLDLQPTQIKTYRKPLLHAVHEVPNGRALTAGLDQLSLALRGIHDMHEVLQRFVRPHAELLLTEGDAR